jgi:hypothetical protein
MMSVIVSAGAGAVTVAVLTGVLTPKPPRSWKKLSDEAMAAAAPSPSPALSPSPWPGGPAVLVPKALIQLMTARASPAVTKLSPTYWPAPLTVS